MRRIRPLCYLLSSCKRRETQPSIRKLVEGCRGVIARVLLQLLMTAATSRRDYALLSVVIYVPISQAHMIRRCQHWLPSLSAARAK